MSGAEEKFYEGGTWSLTTGELPSSPNPVVYDPYPDYDSWEWRSAFTGRFKTCKGPYSQDLDRQSPRDMISVYPGIQKDFPLPTIGSYEALGLDAWVCTDRDSRLGPYGHGATEEGLPLQPGELNWDGVNWKSLQQQCLKRNEGRFKASEPRQSQGPETLYGTVSSQANPIRAGILDEQTKPAGPQPRPRMAVMLRAWHDMEWTPNLKQYVRSLIMELALHTGAEYEVFILLHIRDESIVIDWQDEAGLRNLRAAFIPPEFQDMAILFNDPTLHSWYPRLDEHRAIYQYWQPIQIFSQLHPEFDYFWQLELDSRHTGHAYHFLDRAQTFAREQPRKYLWERNAYWYIPGAYGAWNQFMQRIDEWMRGKPSVWGPVPVRHVTPIGPQPPVRDPAQDNYEWGVGEEADVITFLPIFDPVETGWTFPHIMWNLPADTPRRASPVIMGRLSRAMITLMHDAQVKDGIGLVSEMTPVTFALWHGLKAVHVPHPMYTDGKWTSREIAKIFNIGAPEKNNGGPDSFWNYDHKWDRILYRTTYMFTSQTGEDFYRRWLGYKADPDQATDGNPHQDGQGLNWYDGGYLQEDRYGKLCFPPMLLHPVKNPNLTKGKEMAVPV
ncbi:hypothetical protein BJX76DRAFT_356714 [Aspergillus varians]